MILLDTHIVVWAMSEPRKLSRKAQAAILEAGKDGQLGISSATLLELSILGRKGRIVVGEGLESFLKDVESRFTIFPIRPKTCVRLLEFPEEYPGDPIDQIIGATAVAEEIPLVTADERIRKAKVCATIW